MQTIIYTDTDKIRSVLGVEIEELSDATITDRELEKELRLDLLSWFPDYSTSYATGSIISATESQKSIADALTLYCTYFCSTLVVKSLQLSAPQSISDGKNAMSRFATIDWQALTLHLRERLGFYKTFAQNSISAAPEVNVYTPFTGVGLAVDPITGQ